MPRRKRPVLGVDYVIDDRGKAEFTEQFLLTRGYCCELDCRFCPYPQHQKTRQSTSQDVELQAHPVQQQ